jgi:hypothetical protein
MCGTLCDYRLYVKSCFVLGSSEGLGLIADPNIPPTHILSPISLKIIPLSIFCYKSNGSRKCGTYTQWNFTQP